jgi:type IV pilus assembly protein PilF
MGFPAMRPSTLAALLVCAALAACESGPFKRSESVPQQQQQQSLQQQLPPIKVEEATPRYKAELHTDLAAGYFERGQYDVALEELAESLKADPTYPKLYSVYGLVYAELGDEPKAELNFRKGLELAPADSEIRHNWGWYLCTHGRARDSIAEFEAALRNPLYRTPEIALINAGKCSVEAGDLAAADQYLRRALVLKPGNPVAAYNLALLSYRNNRLEESRALMRYVMAQNAPPADALYLGMCIERKLEDRQSEQSYVMQLRNRYPNSPEARAIAGGACQ